MPAPNLADRGFGDPITQRQFHAESAALRHVVDRQPVGERERPRAWRVKAPFTGAVLQVVVLGAEKQVVRSDAAWDVALVADLQAVGYRAVGKAPREAMGVDMWLLSADARQLELAVLRRPATDYAGGPQPAAVGLLDLRPEACFNLSAISRRVIPKSPFRQFTTALNLTGFSTFIIGLKS